MFSKLRKHPLYQHILSENKQNWHVPLYQYDTWIKKNYIRKISSRNMPTQFDDVAGIQFWFFIVSRRNKNLSWISFDTWLKQWAEN